MIQHLISTTNIPENFHRRLEDIRLRLGGFFQNEEILGINVILQLDKLHAKNWARTNPMFKACQYQLIQLHKLKFKDYDPHMDEQISVAQKEMADFLKTAPLQEKEVI